MKVDLHLHSVCSDGDLFIEQIVTRESEFGLDVISITDHDTVKGVQRAIDFAKNYNIKVLSGIELSATYEKTETHILVYGMDMQNATFLADIDNIQKMREARNRMILEKLAKSSVFIDYGHLKEKYNCLVLGRGHMAKELINMGLCTSVSEAFEKYLGKNGCAYVEEYRISVKQAIDIAYQSGGMAVLAHPAKLRQTTAESEKYIKYLINLGLRGIEADYFSHTKIERDYFEYIANKYDMYIFGGSDFHSHTYGMPLGSFFEPNKKTEDLIERLIVD